MAKDPAREWFTGTKWVTCPACDGDGCKHCDWESVVPDREVERIKKKIAE